MYRLRPRSLRRRLVLGATVLAMTAVVVSQAIGLLVLHSWLLGRVDQQLKDFTVSSARMSESDPPKDMSALPASQTPTLPSDFHVYFYDASGRLSASSLGSGAKTPPELPATVSALKFPAGVPSTVGATSGDGRWRVMRSSGVSGFTLIVALPLDSVDATMSKLEWLDLGLLIAVAIGLIATGRWVVRLGLRPLTRTGDAAERITAGNLDLRLPEADPATEVGRLNLALNNMLVQLQAALVERASTEARLRRFVADAGHELRTPLTSVQGFAELAAKYEELPEDERREAVRLIRQDAERMSLLVDDLLLLARLDQEPAYRSEPVDLLSIAADAVSSAAIRRTGHSVRLAPVDDAQELEVVEVTGDSHRLRQVVGNLVTNALVHTSAGTSVQVRVGAVRAGAETGGVDRAGRVGSGPAVPQGTNICVIEVADNGPGLPDEQAQRVFERFYRVDPSRSREHGGTGLGLAIAAAIAHGHGGRLELDSESGRGCTFRLVLPDGEG